MCRVIFNLLFIFVSFQIFAQGANFGKPEYEKMRLQVFDNTSPYFYPKLFERYQSGDTSLTVTEFRFLYYGYTLQSQYIPYQVSRYQDKMISFMKKGTLSSKELNDFISLCEMNLKDLPFDIRTLNILAFSYKQKGDSISYQIAKFKKKGIISAIRSSGDGSNEKTAFHIIDPAHEYDLLNEMGLEFAGSNDLTAGLCDYLIVQANDLNIQGLYFDVSRILSVKADRNK
jgi:hypothetical protein